MSQPKKNPEEKINSMGIQCMLRKVVTDNLEFFVDLVFDSPIDANYLCASGPEISPL